MRYREPYLAKDCLMFSIAALSLTTLMAILRTVVGIGFVIAIHEFGHFLFAKLFNIATPIFSIGFGPTLIQRKIGETEFRLSLIPLGGYCAIQIEDAESAEHAAQPERSFDNKPFYQKFLTLLGGIIFNVLFAYAAFTLVHWGTHPRMKSHVQIAAVSKDSPAERAGLKVGQRIAGYTHIKEQEAAGADVSYVAFSDDTRAVQQQIQGFIQEIAQNPSKPCFVTILGQDALQERKGCLLDSKNGIGSIGVAFSLEAEAVPNEFVHHTLPEAITKGVDLAHHYITSTANSLMAIFKKRSLGNIGGPLEMFSQTFRHAQSGFVVFLQFLGVISVTLALLNLLPIGGLDGGQLLFVLLEGIIRRPLPRRFKEGIIIASWLAFLFLTLLLSYRDLVRFIQ